MISPSHLQKCELFQQLHKRDQLLLLPNAWDAGSAVLMEKLGFPAIATTSAGIAYANGYSDNEVMGRERMIEEVAGIIERVHVPVSVDLESGYGDTPAEVAETIRQAIAVGAVGANLEDYRVGQSQPLLPVEEAAERIWAASEVIRSSKLPFLLNARIDVYLREKQLSPEERFNQTITRAYAYLAAGAGCIFVPAVSDIQTIARLTAEINAPVNVLGAYSGTAIASLDALHRAGVKRVTIGGSLALYALAKARQALEEMRDEGTFSYAENAISNKEMNELMRKN